MGLIGFVKGKMIGSAIQKLADSEPHTTIAGGVLAAIVAANIDYNKLANGDQQEISKAVAAIVVALLGYWTNHKKLAKNGP